METIEIDDDVFASLQKHARPFVDTPNSTLRRLLGIDSSAAAAQKRPLLSDDVELEKPLVDSRTVFAKRLKAPKAELILLVQKGFLQNGQKLYLIDYQGTRVPKISAVIAGSDLIHNSQRYSMSNLAQELLGQMGFKSSAVRGPAHWVTEEGKSIKDLWQQYLDDPSRK